MDRGDGWYGGTGILCQAKWAFDRDLKAGKLKIVGHGYKRQELPVAERGPQDRFLKVVVIIATQTNEATGTLDLHLISVTPSSEGGGFCYYDTNEPAPPVIMDFKFYHGGAIDLEPKIGQAE